MDMSGNYFVYCGDVIFVYLFIYLGWIKVELGYLISLSSDPDESIWSSHIRFSKEILI
jgi:hypothetical protein